MSRLKTNVKRKVFSSYLSLSSRFSRLKFIYNAYAPRAMHDIEERCGEKGNSRRLKGRRNQINMSERSEKKRRNGAATAASINRARLGGGAFALGFFIRTDAFSIYLPPVASLVSL
ncbi:hypothetical protein PUN28_018504 [Cardiocondyla obscurior]|uniref:Uncharacterized protein n=1 Tax=Cardiocondyla obscurior TaxID=286306 RepID=A0AAW2EE49_9HYME